MIGRARRALKDASQELTRAERLLTCSAVARLLGVSPGSVRRWARERALHASRTRGGHYRVSADEIGQIEKR